MLRPLTLTPRKKSSLASALCKFPSCRSPQSLPVRMPAPGKKRLTICADTPVSCNGSIGRIPRSRRPQIAARRSCGEKSSLENRKMASRGVTSKETAPARAHRRKLYARFTPVQSCVRSSPSGLGLRVRDWPHRGEKVCVAVANSYDLFSFIDDRRLVATL